MFKKFSNTYSVTSKVRFTLNPFFSNFSLICYITVVVVLHRVDNFAVDGLGQKLPERIVSIERGAGDRRPINRVGCDNRTNM